MLFLYKLEYNNHRSSGSKLDDSQHSFLFWVHRVLHPMNPLKKGQPREEDRYMWGRGLHPHTYPSLVLAGGFSSALILWLKKKQ